MNIAELLKLIKNYPDFPEKGIVFRDISPILSDPTALQFSIDSMIEQVKDVSFNKIAAIDARGFIFGGAMAQRLNKGLILCRKPSKLPGRLETVSYGYEYNSSSLSVSAEMIDKEDKILIVDDVLATGNTFLAAEQIFEKLGAEVKAISCLIELNYLNGRDLLVKHTASIPIYSVLKLEDSSVKALAVDNQAR